MPYIHITSFKEGLDARRPAITSTQGSLMVGTNCHITRGGDVEKRKAFISTYTLPSGTFGLHATASALYTFGSTDLAASVPAGVTYQRLISPTASAMTEMVSAETFNGLPYVVARYADGNVHHFYNGTRVTAWDTIAPSITDLGTLGTALAARVDTDQDVGAAYSLVGGTTHTITITASVVNTAFDYTVQTVNKGSNSNNSITATTTTPASGGVAQVVTAVISGTYEAADQWIITINGRSYTITGASSGIGGPLCTFRGKLYTAVQSLLYFSDINNPTNWTTGGAGFINISNQTGGSESLTGLAPYQSYLAVMSRRTTQVWFVDPDPVSNRLVQVLGNIGTLAPRSAIGFGDIDVFFLSDTGIRSLRARDSSNSAVVYDVGTSIDPLVIAQMNEASESEVINACGVIEPVEGRYLLAIGGKIFVYSYFPGGKISAWTTYEPGFTVSHWAVQANRLYARSGDTIYLYGGSDGSTYDDSEVVIELAAAEAGKPPMMKKWRSVDMACEGTWQIEAGFDPRVDEYDLLGHVIDQNVSLPNFEISGQGTHISLKFTHTANEYARLSACIVHFEGGAAK